METQALHMVSAKALTIAILALLATACGIKIEDDGKDDADTEVDDDDQAGKNQLILITDGAYSVELTSTEVECQRLVDGQVLDLRFRHKGDGIDRGLAIDLRVAGEFDSGDALTPDNSSKDRFFDFALRTPAGESFAFTSTGFGDGPKPDYAALTTLESSKYESSGRIWIENLPAATPEPDGTVRKLSVRGTYECSDWN